MVRGAVSGRGDVTARLIPAATRFSDPTVEQAISPSAVDRELLSTEVAGRGDAMPVFGPGGAEIPNRDPVLQYLAPAAGLTYCDERVFVSMEREHKIQDGRRHLQSEIFSHGWTVQNGPSGSPNADRFREFGEALWSRMPQRQTVLKRLHDSTYYGWRPMQVVLDTDARFDGRAVWMPARLVDKDSWRVRFLREGGIVYKTSFGQPAAIFGPEEAALGWLCPRVGTLDSPYGRGLLSDSFMLWFAKQEMWGRFHRLSERALGLTKVTSKTTAPGDSFAKAVQSVRSDVEALVGLLNDKNILLETGDWVLDWLSSPSTIETGIRSLQYLDEAIMTLFCGEILTSNPGDRGTQALGTVQRDVKSEYAREASMESVEGPMTDLLARYVRLNFGDVDPEDLPVFVSRARHQVNPEAVRQLFDMGAPINATRLADSWGVREVLADGDEEADDLIVQQTAAPAGLPFDFGPDAGQLSRRELADEEDRHIAGLIEQTQARARDPARRYLEALRRAADPEA